MIGVGKIPPKKQAVLPPKPRGRHRGLTSQSLSSFWRWWVGVVHQPLELLAMSDRTHLRSLMSVLTVQLQAAAFGGSLASQASRSRDTWNWARPPGDAWRSSHLCSREKQQPQNPRRNPPKSPCATGPQPGTSCENGVPPWHSQAAPGPNQGPCYGGPRP